MEFISDTSFCGIDCTKCPVYRATTQDSDILREKVANKWGRMYKIDLHKEDIYCLGCKSKTVFKMCSQCHFRDCTKKRRIDNCSDCEDYPCPRVEHFYDWNRRKSNKTFEL